MSRLVVIAGTLALWTALPGSLPAGAEKLTPGTHEIKLDSAGHAWTCYVHVPKSYRAGRPVPLVLVLHGAGGGGKLYLEKNHWQAQAEKSGFIAVAPDGLPSRPTGNASFLLNPRVWNSGQLRPLSPRSRVDDVQFFRELLDDLQRRLSIDADRVYLTGHSNGAGMTFKLGAELPERFAALSPVSGVNWIDNPRPKQPRPTLFIIGTKDPLIPLEGGESTLPWGKRTTPPVSQGLNAWAKALGCSTTPKELSNTGGIQKMQYGPGKDGATLTVWYIDGQGHGWPGGREGGIPERLIGPDVGKVNATEVIWDFFQKHTRK